MLALILSRSSTSSMDLSGKFSELAVSKDSRCNAASSSMENGAVDAVGDVHITCFTEELHDVILHFQIIRFANQIFTWLGCNSSKFGHLYAALATRPTSAVSVAALLGGGSNNTGSSVAPSIGTEDRCQCGLVLQYPKFERQPDD